MSLPSTSLLLLLLCLHGTAALKICSFNVRSFGESKKENEEAMDIIVKVSSFDGQTLYFPPTVPRQDYKNLSLSFIH